MPGRIVLFGATGYTGRLVAEAMVERGLRPVLAARDGDRLHDLVAALGTQLETLTADVSDPPSVTALVDRGDVLVSTVGPFARWGAPAAAAATTVGAHYIDSTGEPPFIREVFERYGVAAEQSGSGMLTAFGYDWVPGNLAGALALSRAGEAAVRVDTGYFVSGVSRGGFSGGTMASLAGVMNAPSFAFRDGRVQAERGARRTRTFHVGPKTLSAISVGASEHFTLPRLAPGLTEVNAYLGWFGSGSRAIQMLSAGTTLGMKLPGASALWDAATERFVKGSTGGPDAAARARARSHIVAIAYDSGGRELSEVHVTGGDPYGFTGRIMAWGAEQAAAGRLQGVGALGPADGFGLEALVDGCRQAGMGEAAPAAAEHEHTTVTIA
ncbi:MAG: NAD(P)H-binding protein [Thermoleophilaceae bacterium]|nr:NAD(P)H-binding protein [Thermoleophilaceae bacterium]